MLNKEYYRDFYYKTISKKINDTINSFGPFDRTLHIECDNGFMVEFIQSNEIHGMDNSNIQSVPIVKRIDVPDKIYDLIVLSEKDYNTYNKKQIHNWVVSSAARIIAVIGTKEYVHDWNFGETLNLILIEGNTVLKIYEFDESLRIYE
jgi:hypothetical protein